MGQSKLEGGCSATAYRFDENPGNEEFDSQLHTVAEHDETSDFETPYFSNLTVLTSVSPMILYCTSPVCILLCYVVLEFLRTLSTIVVYAGLTYVYWRCIRDGDGCVYECVQPCNTMNTHISLPNVLII